MFKCLLLYLITKRIFIYYPLQDINQSIVI